MSMERSFCVLGEWRAATGQPGVVVAALVKGQRDCNMVRGWVVKAGIFVGRDAKN